MEKFSLRLSSTENFLHGIFSFFRHDPDQVTARLSGRFFPFRKVGFEKGNEGEKTEMNKYTVLAGAALTIGLAACGGGGGGSDDAQWSTPTNSPVQGAYEGTVSNGRYHNTLILENDEYYTMYGTLASNVFYVLGFIHGNGQANNGSFVSTNLKDYYANGTVVGGTLNATYQPGVSFNGAITEGGSTMTFTGAPLQNRYYNYNATANLTNIIGAWSGTDLQGNPATVNVASNGSFSGSSAGCSFSGSLAPRPSGKNVFNLSVSFGASPCILANQSLTGIGLEYLLANGKRQFIAAATSVNGAAGMAFIGQR
jgi:hypothetical protein